jgi:hypothetical protein
MVLASDGKTTFGGAVVGAGVDLINKTDFSAVSSVSLNSVFSSTYQNYRIIINSTGTVATNGGIRLRSAGSDNSSSNYTTIGFYMAGASVTGLSATDTSWNYSTLTTQTNTVYEFYSPNASEYTRGSTSQYASSYSLVFPATTTFDGFTIFPASGTITGTVRVYGYRNS